MKCDDYSVTSLSIFQMAISRLKPLFQLFKVQFLGSEGFPSRHGAVAVRSVEDDSGLGRDRLSQLCLEKSSIGIKICTGVSVPAEGDKMHKHIVFGG
jgi:hypothetical protein